MSDTLPKTIENAKAQLSQNPIGKKIVEKVTSPQAIEKAQGLASTFFKSTFGVFADIYVVLFFGIFFTVSPGIYKKGIIQLIPKKGQQKGEDVLDKLGENLKKWLKGKIFSMAVVMILTAIGLAIIGVVLAIMAGLLSFMPNFGPLMALIPAVLIGLMQSPATAAIEALHTPV